MRVDFHTHYIPKHFPDMAEKYGDLGWPTLLHTGLCQADIYNAGKHYRSIDDRSWEPERRIKDMDAEGVNIQVLSPGHRHPGRAGSHPIDPRPLLMQPYCYQLLPRGCCVHENQPGKRAILSAL